MAADRRAALYGTVGWAVAVWLLGEGAGGLLSRMAGMANPLTGAPGAAVLYALLALLIWPSRTRAASTAGGGTVADGSLLGRRGARAAWVVLWGSLAYLAVQPGVWSAAAMRGTFTGMADGEPHWLAAMNNAFAVAFGQHAAIVSMVLAAAFALAGAGILWPATARPALILAAALAVFIWIAGEDFGGIFTGHATDPNSGPLLLLLAAAFWPYRSAPAAGRSRPDRRPPLPPRLRPTGSGPCGKGEETAGPGHVVGVAGTVRHHLVGQPRAGPADQDVRHQRRGEDGHQAEPAADAHHEQPPPHAASPK